ncbi:kinesin-like protein KIF15 [Zophobas morio]|uniref:kinesin-like protein KIF15 n=1 Tax=Zophobas morio TaxID=2755281 RepID=UPI00308272CE
MNQESSRSHAVFTVTIQSQEIKDDIKVTRTAKLDLVDLAGSERQKHTNALGATLKESCKINQSLSTLGKVIKALIEKEKPPYRDCLLTHLLSNSLGGNSKTYFLATIHQDADQFFETRSTLLFTQRMQLVQNKAVINEETHETFSQLKEKYLKLLERFEGNADDNKVNFESVKKMNAFLLREKIRMQERIDNYEAVKELDDKTIKSLNQRNQNLKMKVKFLQRRQTKNDWISEKELGKPCEEVSVEIVCNKTNPEVTQYASNYYMLKQELKTLKTQYSCFDKDNIYIKELKEYIQQLEEQILFSSDSVELPETSKKTRATDQLEDIEKWKLKQTVDMELQLKLYNGIELECNNLKNELKEVEMELHEVKGEKETLIIEKNLLAATLEELKIENEELQKVNNSLEFKINKLLDEANFTKSELQQNLLASTAKLTHEKNVLTEKLLLLSNMEEKNEKVSKENIFLQEALKTEKHKNSVCSLQVEELTNKLGLYEELDENNKQMINDLNTRITEKSKELSRLMDEQNKLISQHNNEKIELQSIISKLEHMIDESELNQQLSLLTRKYQKLKLNYGVAYMKIINLY